MVMNDATIGLIGGFALNVFALIWGAAKLSSKLDNLADAFTDHVKRVDTIEKNQVEGDKKVAILWDGHERREGVDERRK